MLKSAEIVNDAGADDTSRMISSLPAEEDRSYILEDDLRNIQHGLWAGTP